MRVKPNKDAMKKLFYVHLIGFVFLMTSCGQQKSEENIEEEPQTSARESELEKESKNSVAADTVQLEITADDQMNYSKKEMRVKAGQVVVLTLKHVGKLPVASMGHNWVLLKEGADMEAFAMDAIQAKDSDYIPQHRKDDIIANTKMLGGGEYDTITFTAPEKGTYTFLCSFPGHYMAMNGKFIVE